MTDKQIIECPFKGNDKRCKAHLNEVFWWKCYEFDNCLYKKYKAKEQECETLASQLDFEVQKKECLEQECERLKNENKRLVGELANNVFDGFEELDQLKVENEKLATALKFRDSNIDAKNKEILKKCKNNRDLIDKNWKLIKTLDEIKEIVKCSCFLNCGKCPMDKKCKNYCDRDFNLQDIITQKISEVEDEIY